MHGKIRSHFGAVLHVHPLQGHIFFIALVMPEKQVGGEGVRNGLPGLGSDGISLKREQLGPRLHAMDQDVAGLGMDHRAGISDADNQRLRKRPEVNDGQLDVVR